MNLFIGKERFIPIYRRQNKMEIKIKKRLIIPELKSLSGVEIIHDKIVVTGDNLPDAYQINEKGKILKKYNLIPKTEF